MSLAQKAYVKLQCFLCLSRAHNSWPEQNTRQQRWVTIPEAAENCRHAWMREVLEEGFCKWHEEKLSARKDNSAFSVSSSPPD
ncbi:hypothetical protein IFM89_039790 [Coptis chinensis]|uniref:Uncharacterized protein n=1 Tax=Coptis chinensis TaxID=261450 RepID=A0A835GXA5_9MAGN|nr:hypothetical protein IFM89_039790 [Coptis chinensis]